MRPLLALFGAWLLSTSVGCDDADSPSDPTGGDATLDAMSDPDAAPREPPPPFPEAQRDSQDFIVTEMNFYFPDGLAPTDAEVENPCGVAAATDNTQHAPLTLDGLLVDGFDLDGVASNDATGLCGQRDYTSTDGTTGIDYAFLHVIDMVRPARPGQTVQTVLRTAVAQGLLRAGLRLEGVDDWENDDHVELLVTHTLDTPLLGTDGKVVGNSSVRADPDPRYRTRMTGQIVDGVLTAGPADLTLGHINLLVVRDRVITLKDTVIRARMTPRADGVLDVESFASGWWLRDNMEEAIGRALLTIGANPGELDCVLDQWSDYSSDGERCDGMSMIFKVSAVSGFLTGLEGEPDEAP